MAVLGLRAWLRGKQEQRTEEDTLHSEFPGLVIQSWPHRQSFKIPAFTFNHWQDYSLTGCVL
jgi:hypothetical protein